MTHNFDFFRTLESRLGRTNCLMASKNEKQTTLAKAVAVRNVFATWKKNFFINNKIKIACIPFLRNLIEMTAGNTDDKYQTLTGLLHVRPGSDAITVGDLDAIYNDVCKTNGTSSDPTERLFNVLNQEAHGCLSSATGMNLENKIVLAIAIRIAAEHFLIRKINDEPFVAQIAYNQTRQLIDRFKKDFPAEIDAVAALDQVSLMTPENIHINSFMYEPIIDMSDEHLQKLYKRVCFLT
jgi:hypothetical protein